MKTNFLLSGLIRITVVLLLAGTLASTTGCKKDTVTKSGGFGNVPRKDVPDPFVGDFTYVTNTGGYVDQYGHYIPGVAQGVLLHIERDGTGSSLYHVETGSSSGAVTTYDVKCLCTYEITKTSETTANIIIHYVSGKNYENGVFNHDLDASKLYPNGDTVWNDCQIGTNNEGKTIFIVGSGDNISQFTKE